jgi:alpha-beta hydrolase superfamily lysophospholipase
MAALLAGSGTISVLPALAAGGKTVSVTTTRTTTQKAPTWSRGIKTPYRSWIPVNKPQDVLLCVHGLGFSSASFSQFGKVMAGHGFAVYALDVRGFGQWMNKKGHEEVDFEACLNDVEAALKVLRKQYPGVPIIMVGESMGGAIALAANSRHPDLVDGLISSVPSSDRYAKLSSEIVVGAHYVENSNKPMDLTPEVVDRITDDPNLRAKMEAEPLNRMQLSPKELKQFDTFMKGNNDAAKLIEKTPVLMLAGFKDKLVKPEGTIELFNNLSTDDKLLMIVGDGEHLLLEENQLKYQLALMLTDWIRTEGKDHVPAKTP